MIVSTAAGAPAPNAPKAPTTDVPLPRRAPSMLTVPALDNAAGAASATLQQVSSLVDLLTTAYGRSMEEYTRVVKRGYLDDAISYAQYAYALVDADKSVDDDGFMGIIENGIMEALKGARSFGTPLNPNSDLRDELAMAGQAAKNAAQSLGKLSRGTV